MRIPTIFLSLLLPASLALPRNPKKSTADEFFVANFHASTTTKEDGLNRVAFIAYDEYYDFGFVCTVRTKSSLYSDVTWFPCKMVMGNSTDAMSFQISEDFAELKLQRNWVNKGMYLTGYATQPTYWDESNGGNVTSGDDGKTYERPEPWPCEITSIVA